MAVKSQNDYVKELIKLFEINMDELKEIELPECWNCNTNVPPLYINCGSSGNRAKATTCLECYIEEMKE